MALQPENVLAKLHKLDATQDSICNVSEYCRFFAKVPCSEARKHQAMRRPC